jgi:hypothetical protein
MSGIDILDSATVKTVGGSAYIDFWVHINLTDCHHLNWDHSARLHVNRRSSVKLSTRVHVEFDPEIGQQRGPVR